LKVASSWARKPLLANAAAVAKKWRREGYIFDQLSQNRFLVSGYRNLAPPAAGAN
jgi:hypothetical protein